MTLGKACAAALGALVVATATVVMVTVPGGSTGASPGLPGATPYDTATFTPTSAPLVGVPH